MSIKQIVDAMSRSLSSMKPGIEVLLFILPKKEWDKRITPFYENVTKDAIVI